MLPDIRQSLQRHRDLKAELLDQFPELAEDEQALRDTVEGCSDIDSAIAALITDALEREAQAEGITAYIKRLQDRRARLTAGAERNRALALWAMEEGGINKLPRSTFTASLSVSPPAVNVFNEDVLPDSYFRVKREPDKSAIGSALKNGQDVPGCRLGNKRTILRVVTT